MKHLDKIVVIGLIIFLYLENNWLDIDRYEYYAEVDHCVRICQISDLHSKEFGRNNHKLILEIEKIKIIILIKCF